MRRSMPLIALLVAVSGFAGEVTIVSPRINVVPPAMIQAACGTARPVHGCTNMDATLFTPCEAVSSLFRISAAARLTPVVYTISHTVLAHEMAHVADVAAQLRWYAEAIGTPVYETAEACEGAARVARMTFGERLREFQNVSARKQDGPDAGRVADAKAAASIRASLGD